MEFEWTKVFLTDIYEISSGLSKPADSFGSGFPFLSFKEVFGNYFLPEELAQLVESTEKEREKCSIKRGDVFLTRTSETMDELGMSSVALKDYPEATFNGFTKRLRPKEGVPFEVYPEFIGYCLRSPKFRRGMLAFSTMSTRASLNNNMIGRISICLPPIEIQKNIARVLKCLDDKIKLNNQTNQILEQISKAIFKSWFVDFEPVKAKIKAKKCGQDPEQASMCAISGKPLDELEQLNPITQQQLKTTAALFPDSLVDTELGEIPEGWRISTIDEVTSLIIDHRGKTPKKLGGTWVEYGYPAVSAKNIKGGKIINHGSIRFVNDELYNKWMKDELKKGDIFLTSEGPMGEMYVLTDDTKYCLSQRLYALRVNKDLLEPSFLFLWLQTNQAKADLEGRSTGTTVVGIRQSELRKVNVLVPRKELVLKFERVAFPLFEKLHISEKESDFLSKLRDSLIPKLLSGDLKIHSNPKQLETAV